MRRGNTSDRDPECESDGGVVDGTIGAEQPVDHVGPRAVGPPSDQGGEADDGHDRDREIANESPSTACHGDGRHAEGPDREGVVGDLPHRVEERRKVTDEVAERRFEATQRFARPSGEQREHDERGDQHDDIGGSTVSRGSGGDGEEAGLEQAIVVHVGLRQRLAHATPTLD